MKKISILILVYLFINGCGYKIVNKDKAITFNIIKVNTTGEKRINYRNNIERVRGCAKTRRFCKTAKG